MSDVRFMLFSEPQDSYKYAFLVKNADLNEQAIRKHYLKPLMDMNPDIKEEECIAFTLKYVNNKAPVKAVIEPYLEELVPFIQEAGVTHLLCGAPDYFKKLAGVKNTSGLLGTQKDCVIKELDYCKVGLIPSHKSVIFDDKNIGRIDLALQGLSDEITGVNDRHDIIHHGYYPETLDEKIEWLTKLLDYPMLAADIEAASLRHTEAGISTISFAWSKHSGVAFDVGIHTTEKEYLFLKAALYCFFKEYQLRSGKLIWHNMSYDAKVLIFELFQNGVCSNKASMLDGIETFTHNFEDTKLIAYLATNSAAGNELGLKPLSLPFAGNYGLDDESFQDLSKLPIEEVLEYNLKDSLSTFYVYETYYPKMVADNQEDVYRDLFKPIVKNLLQIELHGMPIHMPSVLNAKKELNKLVKEAEDFLIGTDEVAKLQEYIHLKDALTRNAGWKGKHMLLDECIETCSDELNFGSGHQVAYLLHIVCGLPIIEKTPTGLPSTSGDTLEKLVNHCKEDTHRKIIENLLELAKVSKILEAFIPRFEEAHYDPATDYHYLFGNFNLGGTVSGRLSCSKPNLQQIPSGSKFAKLIKKCFKPPEGYLMIGLDFDSLEDYISALTTKDPNKLKVYEDGYDGHSLRAFSYWPEKFPFDEITPELSFKVKGDPVLDDVRTDSKPCTFALTYQGTWHTLVKNLGMSPKQAKQVEDNYHELYKVSDDYVQERLKQASIDGYVEVAFGLRVRAPLLKKVVWGSSTMPYEAAAEGRTIGNALGQSYGLLNSRAGKEFQEVCLASKYALDIWPIAHIHDAQYFIIPDDPEVLAFVNRELVKCVRWQELPEIQHDTVKIGGKLDIFYPDWSKGFTLPVEATSVKDIEEQIQILIEKL